MLAQWYNEFPRIVRVFDKHGKLFDSEATTPMEADFKMKKLKIKRREKWRTHEWGAEAKVRFI